MKFLIKFALVFLVLSLILNFRWLHAAGVATLAEPCDELLLSRAVDAVADLYGSSVSRPLVGCLNSPMLGIDVSHGQTNFAPVLPPTILIGPQGRSVDVVAHELAHAELAQRVGFVRRELSVPTWFDEGLAMQVDHREAYNFEALAEFHARADLVRPSLPALGTTDFFSPGDQGKYHYAYSKCLLRYWISANPGWQSKLTEIDGLPFRSIFENTGVCN